MKSNPAILTLLLSVIIAAGCGGRDSAASKSAAEFDREQQTGGPGPTGGAHGGHVAGQQPEADGTEPKGEGGMAGMDHSQHAPAAKPPAGAATTRDPMAGMDHSQHGMDHSKMTGMTMPPPVPETPSVSAEPGQPAETLNAGPLDAPAQTSVRDAARSAGLAEGMSGGGHAMSHGTYSQTDAGRGGVPKAAGDDKAKSTAPAADPHAGHRMPAPSPKPSPEPKENR